MTAKANPDLLPARFVKGRISAADLTDRRLLYRAFDGNSCRNDAGA